MLESILIQIFQAKTFKTVFSCGLMFITLLIGSVDITVQAMFFALVIDLILGLWNAVFHGQFCKVRFKRWLYKVMLYMVALILGHISDLLVFQQKISFWFQNFIIIYLGLTEVLSAFRHLGKMGLKMPQKIIDRIEGYRDNLSISK
mgnify:CR=1 FL=1